MPPHSYDEQSSLDRLIKDWYMLSKRSDPNHYNIKKLLDNSLIVEVGSSIVSSKSIQSQMAVKQYSELKMNKMPNESSRLIVLEVEESSDSANPQVLSNSDNSNQNKRAKTSNEGSSGEQKGSNNSKGDSGGAQKGSSSGNQFSSSNN